MVLKKLFSGQQWRNSCGTYTQWNITQPQKGMQFESVLMRWMNLEPNTQTEVTQKEKDKYHILTHIYRIQKNGTEEVIFRAAVEKQTQTYGHGERRGEGEMYGKSNMETYITMWEIDSQWQFAEWLRHGALYQSKGVGWGGRWTRGSKGRGYMYTCG